VLNHRRKKSEVSGTEISRKASSKRFVISDNNIGKGQIS